MLRASSFSGVNLNLRAHFSRGILWELKSKSAGTVINFQARLGGRNQGLIGSLQENLHCTRIGGDHDVVPGISIEVDNLHRRSVSRDYDTALSGQDREKSSRSVALQQEAQAAVQTHKKRVRKTALRPQESDNMEYSAMAK